MDYHKLIQRLAEINQPIQECGDMMSPMTSASPDVNKSTSSMSLSLNAQGVEDIKELMKLVAKVNPDMPTPTPMSGISPGMSQPSFDVSIGSGSKPDTTNEIAPLAAVGAGIGRAAMGAAGAGTVGKSLGSIAGRSVGSAASNLISTDDDTDDYEDDPELESSEYENEPDEDYKDIDYITNKVAGGLSKPQRSYPKVAGGDNPMQKISQMEGAELRAAIRSELLQRLAEAKGAK
jgi:hypothetical protein